MTLNKVICQLSEAIALTVSFVKEDTIQRELLNDFLKVADGKFSMGHFAKVAINQRSPKTSPIRSSGEGDKNLKGPFMPAFTNPVAGSLFSSTLSHRNTELQHISAF